MLSGPERRPDGPNVWPGRVEVMSFMGTYVRYRVAVAGTEVLDVVAPPTATPYRAGADVCVSIAAREAMLLAAEPAASAAAA